MAKKMVCRVQLLLGVQSTWSTEMSLGSQQLLDGHLPQLHQDSMRQPCHLSQVFQEIRFYETKLLLVSVHDHVSSLRNAAL